MSLDKRSNTFFLRYRRRHRQMPRMDFTIPLLFALEPPLNCDCVIVRRRLRSPNRGDEGVKICMSGDWLPFFELLSPVLCNCNIVR